MNKIYEDKNELTICQSLCYELSITLMKLEKFNDALKYFNKVIKLSENLNHSTMQLICYRKSLECTIQISYFIFNY